MAKIISLFPILIMILIWKFNPSSPLLLNRRKSDAFQNTGQVKRISGLSFLGFILYFSTTAAFSVWFLADYSPWITTENLHPVAEDLWEYGMSFLWIFIFFVCFTLVKFFIIKIMGVLYRDMQISSLHLQQYIHVAQFVCTILALVMCLSNFLMDQFPNLTNYLVYFLVLSIAFMLIFITIQLNKLVSYRKIYLFSYLCATEYILVLLSVKFFTNL